MWPLHDLLRFRRRRPTTHPKGRPYASRSGQWFRSDPERRVADWLDAHAIVFEYEADVDGMRPDFLLPGRKTIIEYWGGAGFTLYAQRMEEKTRRYEALGYRVVHVVKVNLWELDRVLRDALLGAGPHQSAD